MIRQLRRTPRLAAVVAASLVLTATACSSGSGSTEGGNSETEIEISEGYHRVPEPEGEPTDGGTLVVSEYAETRSLDPTQTIAHGSAGGNALAAIYDLLVRYDARADEFEPWLAKSLESNENLTQWTLTLREGVTFSDGSALDAEAVVGSIGYYMKNKGSDAGILAAFLAGMEPVDDQTVVFTLRQPWSTFPYILARGAGMIMAPAAYSGSEFKPIGAGPFALEDYSPGETMVLTRRDDYWNGKPHLDKIELTWVDSDDARLDVLNSEQAHLVYLREGPAVWEAARTYSGHMHLAGLGDVVQINTREGHPGADPRVRKALALAIDPRVVFDRAQDGKGLPVKKIMGAESTWYNEGIEPTPTDVEQARTLLEEAKADGFDGKIGYLGGAGPTARTEALAIKAMLERAGFTVDVELLRTVADRIERMYVTHDFDIARGGVAATEMSPFEGLYVALSSKSYINAGGYASEKMDALLSELQGAASDAKRAAALAEIERLFVEDVPLVPLGTKASYYPWQENVHGVKVSADQILLLGEAWIDE